MDDPRERRQAVVIGGGLGGLCAATLLARAGFGVRLFEEAARPGGRARSRVQDGYVLNAGAHALYNRGPAMELFAALGIEPRGGVVDGKGAFVLRAGRLHPLPVSALGLLRSDLLGYSGKWQMLRMLATLGERKARALRGSSVSQWLESASADPSARALAEMFVRLTCYAHAPDLLSAEGAARQLSLGVKHGVRYLDGGWQALVDAVAERAREAGVQLELGAGVERIDHSGGAVVGVTLRDGRRVPAHAVAAALEPRALARLLPGDACTERWAAAAVPLRAACLDLGVRGLPHPERINVLSTETPLYYANHSAYARLAPEGGSVLQLVRYLGPGEDGKAAEAELRDFLERIQPGVYERAAVRRFAPNLVVHTDLPAGDRARTEHPELAGLHIISDANSSRAMLTDAVLDSARGAAERIAAWHAASRTSRAQAPSPERARGQGHAA